MKLKIIIFTLMVGLLVACQDENSLIGDQYFEAGKYEQALQSYNDYLKLKPRHVKTIYNRGRCYQELGQYEKAVDDFTKVLKLDTKNENALLSLGQEMYRQQKYKSAILYGERVIEIDPSNPMAYYLMARSNHRQGHTRLALNHYNTAINIDSDFGEAYLHRGALNLFLKRKSDACRDLQKAANLKADGADEALRKNCK